MIIVVSLLAIVGGILQIPSLLIFWLVQRLFVPNILVEFLYPSTIAKYGHLLLMKMQKSQTSGNRRDSSYKSLGLHSRTLEQRVVVVEDEIYIHLLPQFMDNLGYLIVFVLDHTTVVGFLIDVGDANSVLQQIKYIQDLHYSSTQIQLQGLLSTHKHHDHTAGNSRLRKIIPYIYGAAGEGVPHANQFIQNGTHLPIPSTTPGIELECIVIPSHTRGSTVYALHTPNTIHLFTGDSLFLGGSGMPFEADVPGKKYNPMASHESMNRCLAQLVWKCHATPTLVYPGHEYTLDLLQRTNNNNSSSSSNDDYHPEWKNLAPHVYLEYSSQIVMAQHKRTLPKHTKLSTVPNTLEREICTNPQLIYLRQKGFLLITAIQTWYKYLATGNIPRNNQKNKNTSKAIPTKLPSSNSHKNGMKNGSKQLLFSSNGQDQWNLDYDDLNESIFTTVYTHELNSVLEEAPHLSKEELMEKLKELPQSLKKKTVNRRPVPGTLPCEKSMVMGIQALALLGSLPCAMTHADAIKLDLPSPNSNMDTLLIGKFRLIQLLQYLNVITPTDNKDVIDMIHLLWREAKLGPLTSNNTTKYDSVQDVESGKAGEDEDWLELGLLKLTLYAVPLNQSPKWFPKFCSSINSTTETTKYKRVNAELVRHDPVTCSICQPHSVGRYQLQNMDDSSDNSESNRCLQVTATTSTAHLNSVELQYTPTA